MNGVAGGTIGRLIEIKVEISRLDSTRAWRTNQAVLFVQSAFNLFGLLNTETCLSYTPIMRGDFANEPASRTDRNCRH